MKLLRMLWISLLSASTYAGPAMAVSVDDPCAGFTWNVARERALFAQAAVGLAAAKDSSSLRPLSADKLYQLQLAPQEQVTFPVPPGKKTQIEGVFAGLAGFQVTVSGAYRISADMPLWIDVISEGKILPSKDFQGQRGCYAPHKIVEFVLPAAQQLILQLSGASEANVHLSITQSPPSSS
jgi:hypothetical protein